MSTLEYYRHRARLWKRALKMQRALTDWQLDDATSRYLEMRSYAYCRQTAVDVKRFHAACNRFTVQPTEALWDVFDDLRRAEERLRSGVRHQMPGFLVKHFRLMVERQAERWAKTLVEAEHG